MLCSAVLLVAGCGGHEFLQRAPAAVAEGANQLETGIDEYHVAAVEEMDRAAARQRAALKADVAEYVVKAMRSDADPAEVTPEQVAERLAVNFEKWDDQAASLDAERAAERERYTRLRSLCAWMRKVAGQVVEIETRRYATLERLRDLAAEQVRSQVEGTGP